MWNSIRTQRRMKKRKKIATLLHSKLPPPAHETLYFQKLLGALISHLSPHSPPETHTCPRG